MKKISLFCFILFAIISCNNKHAKSNVSESKVSAIDTNQWLKKVAVNSKANSILNTWPEYNAFDSSIDALYEVKNLEDLAIGLEDVVQKQKLLLKSEYPEAYNVPQIKSRQKVVHTYMLKLKADLEYRLAVEETISELLVANNAMRNQFNVVINNPLDNSLILEEKEN